MTDQMTLLDDQNRVPLRGEPRPFKTQLLKWVGNKQRFAHEIVACFPNDIATYREPFLGSGAILASLQPKRAEASDTFWPLMEIFKTLSQDPQRLKTWYQDRYDFYKSGDPIARYEEIKASYNAAPNGPDFLFLCRACYGGVIRFRKKDGYMSTPCGAHPVIKPASFNKRVDLWSERTKNTEFLHQDYRGAMAKAGEGDLVYCDPPYVHSQTILYGAQAFDLNDLLQCISQCKARGARVALSIDGSKKSGMQLCRLDIPNGLFERETQVNLGRSMLRRFQMSGKTLEDEIVTDRLLLTY